MAISSARRPTIAFDARAVTVGSRARGQNAGRGSAGRELARNSTYRPRGSINTLAGVPCSERRGHDGRRVAQPPSRAREIELVRRVSGARLTPRAAPPGRPMRGFSVLLALSNASALHVEERWS